MQNNPRKLIGRIIGISFFILIALFGFHRFSPYLSGPQITSINLAEYSSINENPVIITGTLENTTRLNINGASTEINNDYSFNKTIVIPPGNSIIEIDVYDTFNKKNSYRYSITLQGGSNVYPSTLKQAHAIEKPKDSTTKERTTIEEPLTE